MTLLVGFLAISLLAMPASAAIVIDFEQGSVTGGTITAAGVGTNIPFDVLKVVNGATTTFYDLIGAGPSSATDTNLNGSALVNFNLATGFFQIVGGVCPTASSVGCSAGGGFLVAAGTTLVNGTGLPHIVGFSSTNLDLQQADTKAASLLTALGIPTNTQFALMDANFGYFGFGTTVNSGDIQNIAGVPEPTSILLLGSVMLGVTNLIRRRAKKA
jgi:hypothetical protein